MPKLFIIIAGILGAGAVALGAYSAHGLKESLEKRFGRIDGQSPSIPSDDTRYREKFDLDEDGQLNATEVDALIAKRIEDCNTGSRYQMYHALAIFGIGILAIWNANLGGGNVLLSIAGILMLLGVIGFSGGLYAVVFDVPKLHPLVIPAGGGLMILGWLFLVIAGIFLVSDA